MFTLPVTAVADITAEVGGILTDSWEIIALVVGIPLGFYIIKKLIGLFPKR
jgi:hypothetical protein